eukprot:TRINITY_DN38222_c0_g1_i1.p1 TRINITY_DN38222_c0_g1~~TRINITY_DN38222_c0_g1_i1.p1  ORF type:complete len:131 (-),score=21.28 TRINITY_DN38222_c0_g1_i1:86-478(-)
MLRRLSSPLVVQVRQCRQGTTCSRFFSTVPPGEKVRKMHPHADQKDYSKVSKPPMAPALVVLGLLGSFMFWWVPPFVTSVAVGSAMSESGTLRAPMVGGLGQRGDDIRQAMKQKVLDEKARAAEEKAKAA